MVGWDKTQYPISSANPEVVYSNGSSCFGNLIYERPGSESDSYDTNSPVFEVSDHLVALFDKNDGRRGGYINSDDDVTYHRWAYHKIDDSRANFGVYKSVSDVFSIRTAEAYLNLAEADAQLGNDKEANDYLNRLHRARIANVADLNLSGQDLINAVREERERELDSTMVVLRKEMKKVKPTALNDFLAQLISISMDKEADRGKWLAQIRREKPAWPQFILSKAEHAKISKDYGVKFIPRFILIDADGNLVNADATRPSDPEIYNILDSLLE